MGRNVEVKARVASHEGLAPGLEVLSARLEGRWLMRDVFFGAEHARLKLRTVEGVKSYLIAYRRSDCSGPKGCEYELVDVPDPSAMDSALTMALGRAGEVRKIRTLYMIGRTRVHLDDVAGLGLFMELEVVLEEGESHEAGEREARRIMDGLGIRPEDLVEGAYVDLLAAAGGDD